MPFYEEKRLEFNQKVENDLRFTYFTLIILQNKSVYE